MNRMGIEVGQLYEHEETGARLLIVQVPNGTGQGYRYIHVTGFHQPLYDPDALKPYRLVPHEEWAA